MNCKALKSKAEGIENDLLSSLALEFHDCLHDSLLS